MAAIEPKTETYIDLPLTNFPVSEDTPIRMSDVDAVLMPVVLQYNQYYAAGNLAACNTLLSNNPNLVKCLFNADKYNWLRDAVIAVQRYYLEDVQTFINTVAQNTIGIEDNPTEEQMSIVTYSASKIDEKLNVTILDLIDKINCATGILLATNIPIPMDSWADVVRDDGFKYSWTYENENILETDEVLVYFNNASMISASKAMIVVDEDGSAGSFNLIAVKKPKTDLTIREIKVVKQWQDADEQI